MNDFLQTLLTQRFLQNALLAALFASFGCGIVGTYVVVKRIGYMAGGIAHTVLGGMGVAYFLGSDPLPGAMVAAVLSALLIGWVSLRWKQQEDVIIGALWAVGMAVGILFIARTPGYNVDLMSYLFGNILMVSRADLIVMAVLDAVVFGLVVLCYKQFLAVCFDEEFARIRGVNVAAFYLLLLCLVAVTVVSLIQVVGLILVIALFTLPAATARQFVRSVAGMMIWACVLGAAFGITGLAVSYQTNLPSGATIILLAGLAYLVSLGAKMAQRSFSHVPRDRSN
jgi:zinc transport system permease protein